MTAVSILLTEKNKAGEGKRKKNQTKVKRYLEGLLFMTFFFSGKKKNIASQSGFWFRRSRFRQHFKEIMKFKYLYYLYNEYYFHLKFIDI